MKIRCLPVLLLGSILLVPSPRRAPPDGCAILKPADLAVLLGGTVKGKPSAGGCSWSATGGSKRVLAMALKATGPAANMAFAGARNGAAKGGKGTVTDLTGIGDQAFASLESFGVVVVMLKQGRVLQLQYWTGAAGTPKDVEGFRPIAKKAIAAF